jgi:hypothetical protein
MQLRHFRIKHDTPRHDLRHFTYISIISSATWQTTHCIGTAQGQLLAVKSPLHKRGLLTSFVAILWRSSAPAAKWYLHLKLHVYLGLSLGGVVPPSNFLPFVYKIVLPSADLFSTYIFTPPLCSLVKLPTSSSVAFLFPSSQPLPFTDPNKQNSKERCITRPSQFLPS